MPSLNGALVTHLPGVLVTPDEWFVFDMILRQGEITTKTNGKVVGTYKNENGLLEPEGGRICIESAGRNVEFTSIEIKILAGERWLLARQLKVVDVGELGLDDEDIRFNAKDIHSSH